ncbi:MAG: hypothetical protein CL940_13145 [Deltaproteobacteria bacterium]|nr:hypothetical protein [Deltaproteobacteria bacterium]
MSVRVIMRRTVPQSVLRGLGYLLADRNSVSSTVKLQRFFWAFAGLTLACLCTENIAQAQPSAETPCVDSRGKSPVIEAGREREVRALFAPHQVGSPLPKPLSAWTFEQIRIEGNRIILVLTGPEKTSIEAELRPSVCAPDGAEQSPSFYRGSVAPAAAPAADLLWASVLERDSGGFYRTFVDPAPSKSAPAQAERPRPPPTQGTESTGAPRRIKRQATSWFKTQSALAVVVILGLLAGLLGLAIQLGALGLRGEGARRAWAQLGAITVGGAAVRAMVPATFLREAYPLPNVHYLVHGLDWSGEIATYPQAQALVARGLSPLLSSNPFEAWFQLNFLLGVLSIPAAWAAGAALTGSKRVAMSAALLLACWPQHIRFTASESTHVGFVLGILVTVALASLASRSDRIAPFVALVFSAALTVLARPEGALMLPGLAILALGAGAGSRDIHRRPLKLLAVLVGGALIAPTLLHIATSDSASAFDPEAGTGEALSVATLANLAFRLVWPSEENAFFDLQTCPPWLYLLALFGTVTCWRARRTEGLSRLGLVGLLVIAMSYFTLYAGMEPAITIWGMGRYHLSILPIVVLLSAMGLDALCELASSRIRSPRAPTLTTVAVPILGMALWWPAVTALPMDWQTELDWLLKRGRDETTRIHLPSRLVLPDNRRRFRDLSPRSPVIALSGGEAREETSVTIAQAIEHLEPPGSAPVYFLEGLYCHLAVDREEPENPQCAAMKATFELELVDKVQVTTESFLVGYAALRKAAPFDLNLWRVTGRKLTPEEGLRLLPRPIIPGDPRAEAGGVIASPTSDAMWPSVPAFP